MFSNTSASTSPVGNVLGGPFSTAPAPDPTVPAAKSRGIGGRTLLLEPTVPAGSGEGLLLTGVGVGVSEVSVADEGEIGFGCPGVVGVDTPGCPSLSVWTLKKLLEALALGPNPVPDAAPVEGLPPPIDISALLFVPL
jgi:hypothetical protein